MKIEAIIFDLGGVLLNIDYNLTIKAFKSLGINDFESKFSQANQSELFDKLETGEITEEHFCGLICNIIGKKIPNEDIVNAWNRMLLDLPKERLELLQKVKQHYQSYLLSNTNIIHLKAFTTILQKENNVGNLQSYFHEAYYSHEINKRKPDTATFEWLLKQNSLSPETTLFIDDSIQHIKGAKKLGLFAYHLKNKPIQSLFDSNGLLLDNFLAKLN